MCLKSSQGSWLFLYYLVLFVTSDGQIQDQQSLVEIAKLKSDIQKISKEYNELKMKMESFNPFCQTIASNTCGPCNCKDDDHLKEKYSSK